MDERIRTIIALAAGVVIALLTPYMAFAAPMNNATNTLKISPVRRDIEILPGESEAVRITVTNLSDTAITVRAVANDFTSGDERGTPALILDENQYAPAHSLKRFMAPISNVTIPAKATETAEVVIAIPRDAQAGGYFGAVRFMPVSPDGGGQVNLSASAASLILVTVPGDVTEKLELTNFDIQQNGKSGEMLSSPENLQLTVRFQNQGGIQEGPFGKVSVLQNKSVVYEAEFNSKNPRDMILPGSARRFDIPLKNLNGFGHYTVNATFTYGKDNQTIQVTKSFWVISQLLIIAGIVGAVVLVGIGIGLWLFVRNRRQRNSYNRGHNGLRMRRR